MNNAVVIVTYNRLELLKGMSCLRMQANHSFFACYRG